MRKFLILFSLIFILSGCEKVDQETLKQEIKQEIVDELEYDINDMTNHLKSIAITAKSCSVTIDIALDDSSVIGSGVVYKQVDNQFFILTNEHIIRYFTTLEVYLPNQQKYVSATVEKTDAENDLAIITITSTEDISICEISTVEYAVGELILAVGTPLEIEYANTITLGIISRIDDDFIQHDAAINIGNSGGPLFNLNGQVIGLNASKINTTSTSGTIVSVEGMGFAIPLDKLIDFIS